MTAKSTEIPMDRDTTPALTCQPAGLTPMVYPAQDGKAPVIWFYQTTRDPHDVAHPRYFVPASKVEPGDIILIRSTATTEGDGPVHAVLALGGFDFERRYYHTAWIIPPQSGRSAHGWPLPVFTNPTRAA